MAGGCATSHTYTRELAIACRDRRERVLVDVADQHSRAFGGECTRSGKTDTRCAGSDEHSQPFDFHVHGDLPDARAAKPGCE